MEKASLCELWSLGRDAPDCVDAADRSKEMT